MRTAKKNTTRLGLSAALAVSATLLLVSASPAAAAPQWTIDAAANPMMAPGSDVRFLIRVTNVGDVAAPEFPDGDGDNCTVGAPPPSDPSKCYTVTARFPPQLTPVSTTGFSGATCDTDLGTNTVTCSVPGDAGSPQVSSQGILLMTIVARLDAGASGVATSTFEVTGAGAGTDTTVETVRADAAAPEFGVSDFDAQVSADAAGTPFTRAAGHPYAASTAIEFESVDTPDFAQPTLWPVESAKDIVVDLPPGFVGNPTGADRCTLSELSNSFGTQPTSLCPPTSQVGTTLVRANMLQSLIFGPLPVFNMTTGPNSPARFGFNVFGSIVLLDAELRSESDYGVSVIARNTPAAIPLQATELTFWGVPSDASHNNERACPGEPTPWVTGPSCPSGAPRQAFLRNPTMCTPDGVGLETSLRANSWEDPTDFKTASFESHLPPAYPAAPEDWGDPQGPTDCDRVPFRPSFDAAPAAGAAGQPSGFSFDLSMPQSDNPDVIGQSDLRKAVVTLPKGLRVNPASADGLGACSQDEANLDSREPADCPDSSKIGTVEIETSLLDEPLEGSIYLAKQGDNPFGSLLAVYLAVQGQGVEITLAGHVRTLADGQLVTTFDNQPQAPFDNLHLEFKGGPRAPLTMPDACGEYTINSEFTGWSGKVVNVPSQFTVNANCGAQGFAPSLRAGVESPFAGSHSPFALQVKRTDNDQELSGVDVSTPQGLTATLKGVAQCPQSAIDAAKAMGNPGQGALELVSPACPAASQVGTVVVGAGAGTNPFYVQTGKAYLAGPYKGAPLSFAFVTPAVAGPFDLGNVVVQAAAHVDPVTAQVSVKSDSLPSILHGIPLDIRDLRVNLDRPAFILNPTSCDEMSVDAALTSTQGASAGARDRFQVAECRSLGFKPRLTLSLRGKTNRGAHPALTAILKPRAGDANLSKVSVALPKSEFLDQAHIVTICTRAQFAASECPRGAIYGQATVTTPLFDQKLTGPVYLRSSSNLLPDLVPDLRGPAELPIRIESAGRVDEVNGGIRNTFDVIPDAPFTKLVLRLKGGNKGLLQNSRNICKQAFRATVQMDAHNGKVHDFRPVMKADCGKKSKRGKKGKR